MVEEIDMSKKCKYYRESEIEQYTTECCGNSNSVHEYDIEGKYCQFCSRKIKFKEFTKIPQHLLYE